MFRRLLKLVSGKHGSAARAALKDAHKSLATAVSLDPEIKQLNDRLHEHGRKNHFGERIIAAATRGA